MTYFRFKHAIVCSLVLMIGPSSLRASAISETLSETASRVIATATAASGFDVGSDNTAKQRLSLVSLEPDTRKLMPFLEQTIGDKQVWKVEVDGRELLKHDTSLTATWRPSRNFELIIDPDGNYLMEVRSRADHWNPEIARRPSAKILLEELKGSGVKGANLLKSTPKVSFVEALLSSSFNGQLSSMEIVGFCIEVDSTEFIKSNGPLWVIEVLGGFRSQGSGKKGEFSCWNRHWIMISDATTGEGLLTLNGLPCGE